MTKLKKKDAISRYQHFFSKLQIWIVEKKIEGQSYEKISTLYKEEKTNIDSLSCEAIQTCLKRSSLSLEWIKGSTCGNIPLLSEVDVLTLKQNIIDNAFEGCYLNVEDTIEKAIFLRAQRFKLAQKFLIKIKYYGILRDIINKFQVHDDGRSWVYQHINELEADIKTPRNIELNRLIACTPSNISYYTSKLFPILMKINPALRFCADETMLNPTTHRRLIVPNASNVPLMPDNVEIPHITAMCCCNVIGDKMPLFIILNSLKKLPNDLKKYEETGDAIFSSTSSGWQTRDTFLWFAICFINWLTIYRLKLDKTIRNSPAILIVDGHKSRECPVAIKMLKQNNIKLFVIPAHTSHVTQLFDVGIGSPMKSFFSDMLKKLIENFDKNGNCVGQLRSFTVQAAIAAWDVKCNKYACIKAAKLTGLNPINDDYLQSSAFVSDLTPDVLKIISTKKQSRNNNLLNINCQLISSDENLSSIDEYIKCSDKHKHLILETYNGLYIESIKEILKRSINDCHFLSGPRNYFDHSSMKLIDLDF